MFEFTSGDTVWMFFVYRDTPYFAKGIRFLDSSKSQMLITGLFS